ncbi:MAG: 50S ribosomal protein L29 [Acidobacteria bacterium]|nr:50S ribosomal protein L29 [Acidobacteriota bacterium]
MTKQAAELKNHSDEELERALAEAREELFNLKFQLVTGQLDNPMRIKQVRKDVARILTIMRERELEALGAGSLPAAGGGEA